ncbi:hypothetical protein BH23DEI1_BH23DEI1_23320 [soil metagenome]
MLVKLRRLPAYERRLLVEALSLVVRVRVALWLLPFRRVRRMFATERHVRTATGGPPPRSEQEAIGRAVRRAGSVVPDASCLTQAFAGRIMFARRGGTSLLRIGVAKEAAKLEAHAWVEIDGRVVIGELPDLARFHPMPSLPGDG